MAFPVVSRKTSASWELEGNFGSAIEYTSNLDARSVSGYSYSFRRAARRVTVPLHMVASHPSTAILEKYSHGVVDVWLIL